MGILKRVGEIFKRGATPPAAVFKAAYNHGRAISLCFVDRQRLSRNLECRISGLGKDRVYLKLKKPLPANLFQYEKCNLFFKLPSDILKNELRIRRDPSQNGFLFKSSILECVSCNKDLCHEVCIKLPGAYVRRELRRHERVAFLPEHVSGAGLWIIPMEEHSASISDIPDFSFTAGKACALRLVDISAGGAKIILENVDFLDKFTKIESSRLILRLGLNTATGENLDVWLICGCVASNYNIQLRMLVLRVEFITPATGSYGVFATQRRQEKEFGNLKFSHFGHETASQGIYALRSWLASINPGHG